jgi:hypothetical protein
MATIKEEETGNLIYPLPTGAHLERERSTGHVFICQGDARIQVVRNMDDTVAFALEVIRALRGE